MKQLAAFLFALAFANACFALDIITRKGAIYRHCESIKVEPDGIRFTHTDGSAKVPFEELQTDLQKQYGYDADKAAAYRKAVADAQVAAAKKLADEQLAREQESKREQALAKTERERKQAEIRAEQDYRIESAKKAARAAEWTERGLYIGVGLVCLLGYFVPTIIAFSRDKQNLGAIFALNLFLGWALVGWVIALVWALTKDAQPAFQSTTIHVHHTSPPPPPRAVHQPSPKVVTGRVIEPRQLPPKS